MHALYIPWTSRLLCLSVKAVQAKVSRAIAFQVRCKLFLRIVVASPPNGNSSHSRITAWPPSDSLASNDGISVPSEQENLSPTASTHRYPNPGFLGAYSHSAIFKQVSTHSESSPNQNVTHVQRPLSSHVAKSRLEREPVRTQDITTLKRLGQLDISSLARLLESWTVTGASLTLAQPFIRCSTEAVLNLSISLASIFARPNEQEEHLERLVQLIVVNTQSLIHLNKDSTMDDLTAYLSSNLRWEVIGFFITAVGRACIEIPSFISLFNNGEQRRCLARKLASLSDACLDSCISLDTLTDLQLVLQFENAILHSQVDGDQS